MTKVLGIIGIGLVAGSVIYVLLNKKERLEKILTLNKRRLQRIFHQIILCQ